MRLAVLLMFALPFFTAQAQPPSPLPSVPTTKVLAIGHLTQGRTPAMRQIMPTEVHDTVQLYLNGKIDQWYVRQDGQGVVFLMNVSSVEEAKSLLEKLPLGVNNFMKFDLMPLGPLSPLNFLMKPAEDKH